MYGLLTIGTIFLVAYFIALGLSSKYRNMFLDEKELRQNEKDKYKKEIELYELELFNMLSKQNKTK